MTVSDPIADMLTRVRNAVMVGHSSVAMPSSKIKAAIAKPKKMTSQFPTELLLDWLEFVACMDNSLNMKSARGAQMRSEYVSYEWGYCTIG